MSRYQPDEVALEKANPLCSRRGAAFVLCASERAGCIYIRSPKCKSSRRINHVALRLKTVGVINHLGAERLIYLARVSSAIHLYIALQQLFFFFLSLFARLASRTISTQYLFHRNICRAQIFIVRCTLIFRDSLYVQNIFYHFAFYRILFVSLLRENVIYKLK